MFCVLHVPSGFQSSVPAVDCVCWLQIFNQINSRKIKDEYNPFAGLWNSATFLYILVIEVVLQVQHFGHSHLACDVFLLAFSLVFDNSHIMGCMQ